MESFLGIIALIVLVCGMRALIGGVKALIGTVVNKIRERSQESDAGQSDSTGNDNAFKVMKETLGKIGCQPEVAEDNTINFYFQGEFFQANCGGLMACILDPAWTFIKADDPNLSTVRDAVNRANFCIYPTVVMSAPDEENNIWLHSRMVIVLHPSLPQIEGYVTSMLGSFFRAREAIKAEYQNIDIGQQKEQKKSRKIGFYIPEDNERSNAPE